MATVVDPRRITRPDLPDFGTLRERFEEDDVLTSASALAFQVLAALIPLVLFALAVAGFLNLGDVWEEAADAIRPDLSPASFIVIDDTVTKVIEEQQPLWLTIGLALTLWRISAAMRAVMTALDKIYRAGERSVEGRLLISIGLAVAFTVLLLLAVATIHLGARLVDPPGVLAVLWAIVRWAVAFALLLAAVGLVLHHGPAQPQSLGWVSLGSVLAVGFWLVASLAFAFYVTNIASYGSLFGSFASLFILLTYLYLSVTAFLLGVLVDAVVREESQDSRA